MICFPGIGARQSLWQHDRRVRNGRLREKVSPSGRRPLEEVKPDSNILHAGHRSAARMGVWREGEELAANVLLWPANLETNELESRISINPLVHPVKNPGCDD